MTTTNSNTSSSLDHPVQESTTATSSSDDYDDEDYDDDDEEYEPEESDEESDDEGDEEEDDTEEDEDDDDSTTLWNDVMMGWKQHVIAVLVAIAATVVMHQAYHHSTTSNSSNTNADYYTQQDIEALVLFRRQHAHLFDYQRTANLSFCGKITPVLSNNNNELTILDFNLPKELVPFLAHHYAADALALQEQQAHDYISNDHDKNVNDENTYPARVLQHADTLDLVLKNHDEFACLQNQVQSSTKNHVKGLSYYYQTPTLQSMYRNNVNNEQDEDDNDEEEEEEEDGIVSMHKTTKSATSPRLQPVHLSFTGFAVKVINLSHQPVLLYWDGTNNNNRRLIGELGPFQSLGTASTGAGQAFFVTPVYDSSHALQRWIATADAPVLYHEPSDRDLNAWRTAYMEQQHGHQQNDSDNNDQDDQLLIHYWIQYQMHALNRAYAREYLISAKRVWLAHFPRPLPVHAQWPAGFIGQRHAVQVPTSTATTVNNTDTSNSSSSSSFRTVTLEVVSVLPRVFVIDNFLSAQECKQIIRLAAQEGLQPSTLQAGHGYKTTAHQQRDGSTRSSSNTWLARGRGHKEGGGGGGDTDDSVTDDVYRRAAHILKIDESLLQKNWIQDHLQAQSHSLAESLQVVRYQQGEEYTPHHDFVYPPTLHRHQPSRFATLLLYLNDDFTGGETVFPRAVNTQYHDGIAIQPKRGRAVLFYNMLPDGNMNDWSQHASKPILQGEKWLANLWVWDPQIY